MPSDGSNGDGAGDASVIGHEVADEINNRTHPKVMATECIRDEASELADLRSQHTDADVLDAIHARFRTMNTVLRLRLDREYPNCENCGANLVCRDGQELTCDECWELVSDEQAAEWHRVNDRIWNGGPV